MSFSQISPYFSWVIDKLLAVSALPYHHSHLKYFSENGIHTVVSLSDSFVEPPFHSRGDLNVVCLNTPSQSAPTLNECHQFVQLVENAKRRKEGVLVHSVKGTGRAATLVACYLIKAWECPPNYVVNHLRLIRPISVENADQEIIINKFYEQVAPNFQNTYLNKETRFGNQTDFLGHDEFDTIVDYQPFPEHSTLRTN